MTNINDNILCLAKITAVGIGLAAIIKLGFDKDIAEVKIKELVKELQNKEIENKNLRGR